MAARGNDMVISNVAVLGLGTMGAAMARRIADAGLTLTVWNRSHVRTAGFEEIARIADTPVDAVRGADVVLTMLFDADAVRQVMRVALPTMGERAIWMQSSTVGAVAARELAADAADAGVTYVDAPMLGTRGPAEQGALTALVAGPAEAIDALGPVLDAVASRTVRAGDAPPAASAVKLAANAWIASLTAGIAQSLTVAERLGVDPQLVLDAIAGTATDSAYAHLKGGEMIEGTFTPQFAAAGLLKDIRLVRGETPTMAHGLLDGLEELYADTVNAGHDRDDIAAVWYALQR